MRTEDRIGPYRVLEELGVGGMGEVSLALDEHGRAVAVKVLHPAVARDEVARKRLEREVATMRRVRGPFVAELLDADFTAHRPYIVTRYVQGRTLDEVLRERGPLRGSALRRLARGLARSLVAIHEGGVVHRDLKPSNVMLVDGDPVVIDFGLAHVLDATRLTLTGTAIGTPGYLAPEVLDGERATPASDVFSWGASVVHAATGRPPFGSGPAAAICSRILRGRADLNGVPRDLMPAVKAALSVDPNERPTAIELLPMLRPVPADALTEQIPVPPRPLAVSETDASEPQKDAPEDEPRPQDSRAQDSRAQEGRAQEGRAQDGRGHEGRGQEGEAEAEGVARRSSGGRPRRLRGVLGALMLAVLPGTAVAVPVLTSAACLLWFFSVYARRALRRMRLRITSARGGRAARFRAGTAALIAVPLEVIIRLGLLSMAGAGVYAAIFALTRLTPAADRAPEIALGVLAATVVALRCRYNTTAALWLKLLLPLVAIGLLVAAALTVHPAIWWPLPPWDVSEE
ncbi:serine/threonine-protein kinase [Actinomadura rupiterrae]|uniref:serine/threonine-protein kinase n=1 Tax=Actinomadura rupiterrae TaxID=559627 RepID=UPI0020A57FB8|nr:serine/threonine-protein kinase [Actinomadura rupiterrae]MCP2339884.1 serine/threonine protein kinase [Actinomadura rupiterrae]